MFTFIWSFAAFRSNKDVRHILLQTDRPTRICHYLLTSPLSQLSFRMFWSLSRFVTKVALWSRQDVAENWSLLFQMTYRMVNRKPFMNNLGFNHKTNSIIIKHLHLVQNLMNTVSLPPSISPHRTVASANGIHRPLQYRLLHSVVGVPLSVLIFRNAVGLF